jgi:hypothetical protein
MNKIISLVLLLLILPFTISGAGDKDKSTGEFYLYSIGNSHTWDFRPASDFLEIGRVMGIDIENGKHTWDAISIQTFIGGTGKAELKAVDKFLDFISGSINKDCFVYIYCTWPKNTAEPLGDFDYAEEWLGDFEENDTLEILSDKYFNYLEGAMENGSDKVTFIPLGRVLYHFDRKAKSGEIPGFSGSGALYRDAWHMNNVGRFVAGLTVFSQIFRIDPTDVPDVVSYQASDRWASDRELTAEQKDIIKNIISEVLNF